MRSLRICMLRSWWTRAGGKAWKRGLILWRWATKDLQALPSAKASWYWFSPERHRGRLSGLQLKMQRQTQDGHGPRGQICGQMLLGHRSGPDQPWSGLQGVWCWKTQTFNDPGHIADYVSQRIRKMYFSHTPHLEDQNRCLAFKGRTLNALNSQTNYHSLSNQTYRTKLNCISALRWF